MAHSLAGPRRQRPEDGDAEPAALPVANAPCSYGAFEVTVGVDPNVPEAVELLDYVAGAGYDGIDLGPVGFLGASAELRDRLAGRGLVLAGGYLELPFSDSAALNEALPSLGLLLDTFDSTDHGQIAPRPTLADAGSRARAAQPGRSKLDPSVGLDPSGWKLLADGVGRAVDICKDRGYDPTFHHHTATYVEAQWEIERLLELTEVSLCLDTGHLLLGGGDPVRALRDWAPRINHVHLKDARLDVLEAIVSESAPVEEIWRRNAFCPLGEGDVAVEEFLSTLRSVEYEGWIVVEQDVIPNPADDTAAPDQERNREFLRVRGF